MKVLSKDYCRCVNPECPFKTDCARFLTQEADKLSDDGWYSYGDLWDLDDVGNCKNLIPINRMTDLR